MQAFVPAVMNQIELSLPIPAQNEMESDSCQVHQRAIVLITLFNKPLGRLELPLNGQAWSASRCAEFIWDSMADTIQARLKQEEVPAIKKLSAEGIVTPKRPKSIKNRDQTLADAPYVSVVVATHNRPDKLENCLNSLLALNYPNFDIIVIDNARRNSDTADLISQKYRFKPIRYFSEPIPGLSIAHNRGLCEVSAPYVAFTDDDVIVNPDWLTHIIEAFNTGENVGCVTGMIWPAEMETEAQDLIEQYGGFSKGYEQKRFNLTNHRTDDYLFPYTAGKFGSGANMSFDTAILKKIGGFDPALGAGTKGMGGDDLSAFFNIIAENYTLVYEPAAIVHHWHHREYTQVQKTAYGYGVGLTAYLTSLLFKHPRHWIQLMLKAPLGIHYTVNPASNKNKKKNGRYPTELTKMELKGMVHGPLAYLKSRWHTRRVRSQLSQL